MSPAASRLADGDLLVTVDLAAHRDGRTAHVRTQHGVRGNRVTAVSTSRAGVAEVSHLSLADWPAELARTVALPLPAADADPPAPGLVLPWELLVGTGEARARHRPEVYDHLVARAVGACRADGLDLGPADCHEQLRRLHAATGRVRATGAGRRAQGRRLGLASWLWLGPGWHALVPVTESGWAMVRVEPRRPDDLAAEAAVWLAAVRR